MLIQKTCVLILGGYGKVGKLIASNLLKSKNFEITIAGRNETKAKSVASGLSKTVTGLQIDVTKIGQREKELLKNFQAVIVCVSQHSTEFAKICFSLSLLYLDITAKTDFIEDLRKLNSFAAEHKSLGVLSLGFCPGLTNVFAKELIDRNNLIDEVHTGILLSLGEKHGIAAIEWTLDNFIRDFEYDGKRIKSFINKKEFEFLKIKSIRTAYRFNFSDQHSLKKGYPKKDFSTYLCFDASYFTKLFYWLRKIGLHKILRIQFIKKLAIKLFDQISFGKNIFAVQSIAYQDSLIIDSISVSGYNESSITARMTSVCFEKLIKQNNHSGVKDVQEILSIEEIWEHIKEGLTSYSNIGFPGINNK